MSLSLKIQTRRTERALLPVYENLGRYVDSLQALQNLVAEEISAGHGSNPSVPETIQDAIESLPSPKVFLPNSLRVKKISPHPLPARRKALAELAMATAYLHTLHTRVVADDFSRHLAVSDTTALQLHARYVMECAQSMQDAIEPRQLRSYGVTAGNSMLVYARHVACRANAFRVLSAAAVESFDEARYLELNEDVAIAVNKEQLRSGFEHFARSGLRESQAGHRDSGAFDLRSIKFAGNAKFDTDEVKQCRDVIAACGGFDEVWYRLSCPHHLAHEQKALNHYVTVGEGLGCMPNDWFDPSWYRDFYQLPEHVPSAFAHYLAVGRPAQLKPNALFDPVYYEARYGSSLPANTDLVAHYYQHGFLRGWQPCAQFNVEQYAADCMFEHDITNPVTHYRRDAELGDDMSYGDADTNHYDGVPAIAPTLSDAEHLAKQQGDAYANAILENTTNADRASRVLKTLTRKAARNGHSLAKRSASRAQGHTSRALTRMAKKASKISDSGGVDAK